MYDGICRVSKMLVGIDVIHRTGWKLNFQILEMALLNEGLQIVNALLDASVALKHKLLMFCRGAWQEAQNVIMSLCAIALYNLSMAWTHAG